MLDEDDYELLQESNIAVPRPKLVSCGFCLLDINKQANTHIYAFHM